MNTIRNRFIGSFVIIFFVLLISCNDDFLEQDPQTSLSSDQLFSSLNNVQPFLDGLYTKFRSTKVNRKGFILMLGMDESQQGEYQIKTDADQGGFDKYDGFLEANNKPLAELWNIRWPVVVQASEALIRLQKIQATASPQDTAAINSYIGQASFYRAAVMFELVTYWGKLPMPEVVGENIILSGRKPTIDIYSIIEKDLLTASSLLKSKPTATNMRIPTLWAAKALLGKMYMAAPEETGFRNFQKALNLFQDIISKGGFSLTTNFADLWDPTKNSANEQIFTFYFNNIWPDTNEEQWYVGSRACSSIPTNYIGGYDLILPTEFCRTDYSTGGLWEEGDVRRTESIRYDFINGSITPSPYAGFGDDQLLPHIKKYEDIRINNIASFYTSGKNIYYIRYADILLSAAECMNELDNTAGAVSIVNDNIRKRAWGGILPNDKKWSEGMSQTEFRSNILNERMRELCFEGWRRFDLIRTNQFTTLISQRNRWAKANGTVNDHHKLLPIPLIEIKQNPNLSLEDQNPGY